MNKVSNGYHQAILEATFNGQFPQYSDLWRCYHPFSPMKDSDYYLTEYPNLGVDESVYVCEFV